MERCYAQKSSRRSQDVRGAATPGPRLCELLAEPTRCGATPVKLPSNHPSQARFEAYNRVQKFVRYTLLERPGKITHYDTVNDKNYQFRREKPNNSRGFRASYYPKAALSNKLAEKFLLIEHYNQLAEERVLQPRLKRPKSISLVREGPRKHNDALGMRYHGFVRKILGEKELVPTRVSLKVNTDPSAVARNPTLRRNTTPQLRKMPREEIQSPNYTAQPLERLLTGSLAAALTVAPVRLSSRAHKDIN